MRHKLCGIYIRMVAGNLHNSIDIEYDPSGGEESSTVKSDVNKCSSDKSEKIPCLLSKKASIQVTTTVNVSCMIFRWWIKA